MKKFETTEALVNYSATAEQKTFRELCKNKRTVHKGGLGHIIEESFFGYTINSNKEADFKELGIELKVTPIKLNKNGSLSAKERLVLNIINYMEEYQQTFYTSSFWQKNEKLLLFFYLWQDKTDSLDFTITKTYLHTFSEEDLLIIQNDWKIITTKIKNGEAHLLSEGDTSYLGAATKGANASTLREQPNSPLLAKQRAYSLKASYMTTLVRTLVDPSQLTKFTTKDQLKRLSLPEILQNKFKPLQGMKLEDIATTYDIKLSNAKSRVPQLVSGVLGIKGTKLENIEEFAKANYRFKTIRLEQNGSMKEHMSFPQIDFNEWYHTPFEDSSLFEMFEATTWVFVIFAKDESEQLYFKDLVLWHMPKQLIDTTLRDFYDTTQQILHNGVSVTPTKRGNRNNLPNAKFNGVCHIRPKARDGKDTVTLPCGATITKQSFWLNKEFISQLI